MIPYFQIPSLSIGPFSINVWGAMVALGFLAAYAVMYWRARKRGLDTKPLADLLIIAIVAGLIGGRIVHVLFYDFDFYRQDPAAALWIWQGGLSSVGGFIFAAAAVIGYLRLRKLRVLAYADVAAFAVPFGIFVGRIGCFCIHDHPGVLTDFFAAVSFSGGARHDLGLYLSLTGLLIAAVFLILARKGKKDGFYIGLLAALYGPIRFLLDFLRARDLPISDARYLSLTAAQYASLAFFAFGCIMLYICCLRPDSRPGPRQRPEDS